MGVEKMKTSKLAEVFKILNESKMNKLSKEDMFNVISAMIEMRPFAEKFQKDLEDSEKKCMGDKHEELQMKAVKHNEALKNKKKTDLLPEKEVVEINNYFLEFSNKVEDLRKKLGEKEVEISIKKISEDTFYNFISENNNLTGAQTMLLYEVLKG